MNNCIDSIGTSILVATGLINAIRAMKERGIKIRFITEITKENINYCKELTQCGEVRHLDEVKGNFGILDGI